MGADVDLFHRFHRGWRKVVRRSGSIGEGQQVRVMQVQNVLQYSSDHLASSLQALEEQLDGWNQLKGGSSNGHLESYKLLTKCGAALDDIQFNLMVGLLIPKYNYAW